MFDRFKEYESMATAHFNTKISRFRCDNGGEYLSNELKDFFKEKEIQHELIIRYTPQQNGVAKRMNRSVTEKARCMLLNCKLGKTFWSEAVLAAVYIINRVPKSALNKQLPAVMFDGENPSVKKFKVFGCVAYLLIYIYQKN